MSPVTAAKPRRSAAPLPRVRGCQEQREAELALQPIEDLARAVGRAVVDDDQLDAHRHGEHAADDFVDRVALVEHRHDDRQQRLGRDQAAAFTSDIDAIAAAVSVQQTTATAWSDLP